MKTGKELKPGTVIRIDNDPWLVQKAEFTKSGRNSAIMKTKLKNLLTGYKTETVYSADDKLDDVILDRKEATLSFINGDIYTFMDTTDYTMYELNAEDIEGVLPFIEEGMTDICEAVFFEERLVSVDLPTTIVRQIDYTEGSARGDTSGKVMKPAKLKNGTELSVADFVEIGDWIEIDTREGGSYKGRTKAPQA
ncbi:MULTISPECIES: elongation factor P [Pseudomonas]|uniref:Elongation factor P n=1 Tax=Pseudomonas cavernicola TaxID=2320866 RepID=A0A418XLW5_9PSED|nr:MULTISPECIES: elongation factor P [Pseudomonas]RJG13426.1 elongation factor P [Pseudomonas cavernicola]